LEKKVTTHEETDLKKIKKRSKLRVFSKREAAPQTTDELRGRLIRAAGLHLPDVGGVVAAAGALKPNRRHGSQLLFLFADYSDELFGVMLNVFTVESSVRFSFPCFLSTLLAG